MLIRHSLIIFLLFSNVAFSQTNLELETGGSNFAGSTINASFDIHLGSSGNHIINPKFGLGLMWAWWDENPFIAQIGITYRFKRFGIGISNSHFYSNPYWGEQYPHGFVDMILYPNISLKFIDKSPWYATLSGGAYFAFSIQGNQFVNEPTSLFFEGVIPGGGLTVGYALSSKQ